MHRTYAAAMLAAVAFAAPALAEQATMTRAIEAASLHKGPLDMVAYYVPVAHDTLEVTATFAPRGAEAMPPAPMRVVMGLAKGDDVAFAVPGYPQALYRFARTGNRVAVSVTTDAEAAPGL